MPDYLSLLKQYGGIFGKGLVLEMAPGIASGFLNAYFHQFHIDKAKIIMNVQNNVSLWEQLDQEQRQYLASATEKIDNLDFITFDFVVDSIRKDFPLVASLLLGWPEGRQWLETQIANLKNQLTTPTTSG
jgi:hypothetical protein